MIIIHREKIGLYIISKEDMKFVLTSIYYGKEF